MIEQGPDIKEEVETLIIRADGSREKSIQGDDAIDRLVREVIIYARQLRGNKG